MLGILEGLIRGYSKRVVVKKSTAATVQHEHDLKSNNNMRDTLVRMYRDAVEEFAVEKVFSFSPSVGCEEEERQGGEKRSVEYVLMQRGNAIVSKWEALVMVSRWEVNMDVMEEEHGNNDDDGEDDGNRREES